MKEITREELEKKVEKALHDNQEVEIHDKDSNEKHHIHALKDFDKLKTKKGHELSVTIGASTTEVKIVEAKHEHVERDHNDHNHHKR